MRADIIRPNGDGIAKEVMRAHIRNQPQRHQVCARVDGRRPGLKREGDGWEANRMIAGVIQQRVGINAVPIEKFGSPVPRYQYRLWSRSNGTLEEKILTKLGEVE